MKINVWLKTLFEAVGGKVIVKAASYTKPVVKAIG